MKRLTASAVLPAYSYRDDAGLDLHASEDVLIGPGEAKLIPTGIAVELPPGTEAEVRPRSGLAREHLVTVLNAPGTVDEGYRGEILVILVNHAKTPFQVRSGMKVAQMVIQHRLRVEVLEVNVLGATERGGRGFGSTGE